MLSSFVNAVKTCDFITLKNYTTHIDNQYKKHNNNMSIVWNINRNRYSENDSMTLYMLRLLGTDMNTVNEFGQTLLHVAAEENNEALVDDLLQSNVDVNAVDNLGLTPIFYAVFNRNYTIVQKLVKSDAIVDVEDKEGWTPIMFLSIKLNQQPYNLEPTGDILRLLFRHSAVNKSTLLRLCEEFGHNDLERIIKKVKI